MKEFIRNNKYTLIGLIIGLLIAVGSYLNNKKSTRYRLVFQYQIADSTFIPPSLKKDTFIVFHSIPVRTFRKSITDTLKSEGIKRSELIVYSPRKTNCSSLNERILQPLSSEKASIIYCKNEGLKEYSKRFLLFPLIGILVGYLANLFKCRLMAKKKANTTPI